MTPPDPSDRSSEDIQQSLQSIDNLSEDAKARVSDALKAAIEQETVAAATASAATAFVFSRGWIFSRLAPANPTLELRAIKELTGGELGPDQFAEFADKLAELKRRASPR
jgi:hypothetical protein